MATLTPREPNAQPARRDSVQASPEQGKKRSHDEANVTSDAENGPKPSKQKKSSTKKDDKKKDYDVSDMHLDGGDKGELPIFDTCQDIRTKINAELRKSTTKAELARLIAAQLPDGRLTASQLQRFLDKKGPLGGAESNAYYGGYVFFEKLRRKQGKAESKKRLQVKEAHPQGMGRKDSSNIHVFCAKGQRPYLDSLGRFSVV
ncbi:hypothetical protein CAC42_1352 [Sphaceloma murrayae]|uniref:DUF7726 domain-containing protein n=1 Tax=Sphaceloma murrayae TaxID=2082308 RepID=A0A2K1QG48_9PEZI|nr:hypothetical protein CAC42_1352 [Sphaceloma murrayae]